MAITLLPSADTDDGSFRITIDDTSPTVVYAPFADTFSSPNLTAGWNPFFSDSGFADTTSSDGQVGEGTSFHVTSGDGASLRIRWNGTAVTLYGFFPTSLDAFPATISYSVSLDGVPTTNYASSFTADPNSEDNILAAFTGLANDAHIVELALHNPTGMSDDAILMRFDRAVITSALPAQTTTKQSSSAAQPPLPTTTTLPDDLISYHGQWSFNAQLLPNQSIPLHTSTNAGDSASVQFDGTAVALSGLTTPHSGAYNISLDDAPPTTFSARSSFNASSPTLLFYATGLDPNVAHQLKVVNVGAADPEDGGSLLVFGSLNVTTAGAPDGGGASPVSSMSSNSPKLPRGTIAAITIGASIAAIVFAALAVTYYRRRRRAAQRKQSFMLNPELRRRRFSFLTRRPSAASSADAHAEKAAEYDPRQRRHQHDLQHPGGRAPDRSRDEDVVDISRPKEGEDEDGESDDEDNDIERAAGGGGGAHMYAHARHGSQNSDGSYAINLPELPATRPGGKSPSPPSGTPPRRVPADISTVAANAGAIIASASAGLLTSPRSPKPRGPRERPAVISTHGRDSSRGILLKEMWTSGADVPTDVNGEDSLLSTRGYLPQPTVSPLRVNFEDEIVPEAERRREARHRSETSGISLPYSLKQALLGYARGPSEREQPPMPSPNHRFSFLDLESSTASTSSRSNRQSRSASTHSLSKSASNQDGSRPSLDVTSQAQSQTQDPRVSMGLSMVMAGGPTASQPSNSPNISLQAVSLSPLTIPDAPLPAHADVPTGVHPAYLAELPSPTESVPMTVSDINFRTSVHSSTSQLPGSRPLSGSHHPPLPLHAPPPGAQRPQEKPYIVQKLLGLQPGSGPTTPYGSPTVAGFASRWSRMHGSGAGASGSGSASKPRTGP